MQLRSIMQPVLKLHPEWVPVGPPLLKLSFPAEYNESYIPLVRDAYHLTSNRLGLIQCMFTCVKLYLKNLR